MNSFHIIYALSLCFLPLFLILVLHLLFFWCTSRQTNDNATQQKIVQRERERDRSVAVLPLKFDFFPFAYYCKSCCWYVLISVWKKKDSSTLPAVCFRRFTLSKLFLLHFHFHNFFFYLVFFLVVVVVFFLDSLVVGFFLLVFLVHLIGC